MSDLRDRLKARLRTEEGFRSFRYADSLGHATVGYGFLLEGHANERLRMILGISDIEAEQIVIGARPVTSEQGEKLLDYTAECAITDAGDALGRETWQSLPEDAKLVLADMTFNLGEGGLEKFVKMLAAVREGDFVGAATQMLASKWATQVGGRRASPLALLMAGAQPVEANPTA